MATDNQLIAELGRRDGDAVPILALLAEAGVLQSSAEEELGREVVDERFLALMRFEVARARRLYRIADEGMRYIPEGRRYPVVVARHLYEAILDRIEEQDYDVFAKRAETSLPYKLRVATACAWRNPEELSARFRAGKSGRTAKPFR
ncbi:MAG TPA: squalene/phytoene synthase family protein [Rubrobacteraceae bacterium]|nr:squalene/phytoene synthase family protein [Rubrobacteraceae bacterium]